MHAWIQSLVARDTRALQVPGFVQAFPCLLSGLIGLILHQVKPMSEAVRHGHFAGWTTLLCRPEARLA